MSVCRTFVPMKPTILHLTAFLLGLMALMTGCNPDTDPSSGNQPNPTTQASLTIKGTYVSNASFKGTILSQTTTAHEMAPTLYYGQGKNFSPQTARVIKEVRWINDQEFEILAEDLLPNTTYQCCLGITTADGKKEYTETLEFMTRKSPYQHQENLDVAAATDLSEGGTANCYIISESGLYRFPTVKGNSQEAIEGIQQARVIWESYGSDKGISEGSLISAICYQDGQVAFEFNDFGKEGNALVAVINQEGTILWSWHIWITDPPMEQQYFNNAGTLMDRNLGATSTVPRSVEALGLLYQWGRKDPFLGTGNTQYPASQLPAASTITWPAPMYHDATTGTIAYATAHPTTFIGSMEEPFDWCFPGTAEAELARWDVQKTIYDPCPAGWRVPDGGPDGVWCRATDVLEVFELDTKGVSEGIEFAGIFGEDASIWYPCQGYKITTDRPDKLGLIMNYGWAGYYWSATENHYWSHSLGKSHALYLVWGHGDNVTVAVNNTSVKADANAVRCVRESE